MSIIASPGAQMRPSDDGAPKRTGDSGDVKSPHTSVPPSKAEPSGDEAARDLASHKHATGSSLSRMPTSSTARYHDTPVHDNRSRGEERNYKGTPKAGGNGHSLVKIVVYMTGGRPDYYFNRHVKAHFTSPQAPNMHETVHAHLISDSGPWEVLRETRRTASELMGVADFSG